MSNENPVAEEKDYVKGLETEDILLQEMKIQSPKKRIKLKNERNFLENSKKTLVLRHGELEK